MTTVLLGGNRLTDCRNVLAILDRPLLRVETPPLRLFLRTPDDAPLREAVVIEANENHSTGEQARRAIRVVREARSVGVFWDDAALVLATVLDPDTVHLKVDLRRLGIQVYDDADGLHVGTNVLAGNEILRCETAIGLA